MSTTVAELVAAVIEDGQFDATEAQVLRWLTVRQRQMCARAGSYRKAITLGTTTVGVDSYAVPAEVVEILQLTVGGYVYGVARHQDFARGERGWLLLSGEGGVAGRDDTAGGEQRLKLFPTPAEGTSPEPGAEVVAYCVCLPPDIATGQDATIVIPGDYVDALVAGAISTGMLRSEDRVDLASANEQIFQGGCRELIRATNRRYRGSEPPTLRVVGINA